VVAPLLAGHLADRWFPAERCVAVCAFLAGAALWTLAGLTEPVAVFVAALAFWLAAAPMISLGTALCFAHLARPERQFGPIRLWGTVGWMAAGWFLGYSFRDPEWLRELLALVRPDAPRADYADAFRLGAVLAFLLALFALTLPRVPPRAGHSSAAIPLAVFRLFRGRAFATYAVCTFGVCLTYPFTYQATPLLLKELGVPPQWLAPALTWGQATEVVAMGLLPMLLLRLGLRGTMLVGLAAWALSMAIQGLGRPVGLVVGAVGFNGLCVAYFLVAGQVFVNRLARGRLRASVQALLTFVNGLGMLMGNLLVGWLRDRSGGQLPGAFAVAAFITAGLLLIFLAGFRDGETGD
jgi:MFS family permease